MLSDLLNLPTRDEVHMERHPTSEALSTSGSRDVNLVRMIEDHAPARIGEIVKEIDRYQERIEKLRHEADTLSKLLEVAEKKHNPLPF